MKKYYVADTFDEFSEKDFNIFSTLLFSNDCLQVQMVFDQYWVNSIEGDEHQQRGASIGLKVEIKMDKCCFIPAHDITHALSDKICSTLIGFHAVTGCYWASEGRKRHGTFFVVVSAIKIVCLSSRLYKTWV